MNNRKIILINGKKRAGKDTLAKFLSYYLPDCEITHFAKPMKEIVAEMLNMPIDDLEVLKNVEEPIGVYDKDRNEFIAYTDIRKILQVFGSGKMKEYFGKDVWAKLLYSTLPDKEFIIVPDFRFPEEYRPCDDDNIITIRIKAPWTKDDNHISENALADFKFDYDIINAGSLDDLNDKAKWLAKVIMQRYGVENA